MAATVHTPQFKTPQIMNEDDVRKVNECFEERSGAKVPPPRRSTRPSAQTPSEDEHPSDGPGQAEGNGSGPDFRGPHGGAGPKTENPAGQHGPKSATAWPEPPRPLEEYLSPVLSITADMMPEAMGDWAPISQQICAVRSTSPQPR